MAVDVPEGHQDAVTEFFELFKTPWTHYGERRGHDFGAAVLFSASTAPSQINRILWFGPQENQLDRDLSLKRRALSEGSWVTYRGERFRLGTAAVAFESDGGGMDLTNDSGAPVGLVVRRADQTFVRVGFDLFAEVKHLLSKGQSPAEALSPTIEILISLVRDALLAIGMPVVEIPPCPLGHPFAVCLTHDIDFMGIRLHRMDHTLLGFAYRVVRSLLVPGVGQWRKVWKNVVALLSLPAVYLRLIPDFWYPLDRYAAVEADLPSTYFFIPFAGRPGRTKPDKRAFLRAAPYDVNDYAASVRDLERGRAEVGVHGIDAWCDATLGKEERDVIRDLIRRDDLGVRMHWLYFSEQSPTLLESAGYSYDSTLGFNDAVGFRNGTTQVFQPTGVSELLELPLQIQDTAMLFPGRMHLSEAAALRVCERLIARMIQFGGVLTINWHDRSLAPERNWDEIYIELLKKLRTTNPWFAQAREAVEWFRRRRAIKFTSVTWNNDHVKIGLSAVHATDAVRDHIPPPILRVHSPSVDSRGRVDPTARPSVFEVQLSAAHACTVLLECRA